MCVCVLDVCEIVSVMRSSVIKFLSIFLRPPRRGGEFIPLYVGDRNEIFFIRLKLNFSG